MNRNRSRRRAAEKHTPCQRESAPPPGTPRQTRKRNKKGANARNSEAWKVHMHLHGVPHGPLTPSFNRPLHDQLRDATPRVQQQYAAYSQRELDAHV